MSPKTLVLNNLQISQKITRIAYQIYEDNSEEKEIILAGILPNGYLLSKRLKKALERISPITIKLMKVEIDKENPVKESNQKDINVNDIKNKVIVLVDDVLNSGKTLIYGSSYFLIAPVKRLRTVVLVDRNHNRYPVKADYAGISLSTTLQEHISVELSHEGKDVVYLS